MFQFIHNRFFKKIIFDEDILQSICEGSRLAALYKFTLKAPKVHDLIHQDFGSIAIRIPSGANQNFWLPR